MNAVVSEGLGYPLRSLPITLDFMQLVGLKQKSDFYRLVNIPALHQW